MKEDPGGFESMKECERRAQITVGRFSSSRLTAAPLCRDGCRNVDSLTPDSNSGIVHPVKLANGRPRENGKSEDGLHLFWRWLQPGLGVKRWIGLMILGAVLIGLGLAYSLLDVYRTSSYAPWLDLVTLRALPRWLRALLLGTSGLSLLLLAVFRLNRALLAPFVRPGRRVVQEVAEHRRLERGPRIVAIGGGTGLSTLLRGLKLRTSNLTAIVTVADDGGSSGRIRRSLGLPPPGDLRNCRAALSDDEDLLTQLFQYRFSQESDLDGHSFGNLFIAALSGVKGSFDRGILEAGRVLAIRGRVLPATLANVALVADKSPVVDARAVRIEGESRIPEMPGKIRQVHLDPNDPPAYPETLHAILNADMIVIGPGSLYTSVIPNLLVPEITAAIRASRAFKVYVCNVATQPGETDGYDCAEHHAALDTHVGRGLVDLMVVNNRRQDGLPEGSRPVLEPSDGSPPTVLMYATDLIDENRAWRHDSAKLANTLIDLLEERTGPLESPARGQNGQISGLN
jgi:uncharacterized cofD-like protein